MADDKSGVWRTVRGRRVYIKTGQSLSDAMRESGKFEKEKKQAIQQRLKERMGKDSAANTQEKHAQAVAELSKDTYTDGTYDIDTKQAVEFDSGYQVTFCQIGDDYSPDEYDSKVHEFLSVSSDGKTYAGKFESTPEISFHVNDREVAVRLAKKYNQISIWDWQNCRDEKTGGTGRRNS